MPRIAYRFRVERPDGERSQAWRLWVDGAEAYLAPRSTSHQYKASFHSSGQCQVGLSSEIRHTLIGDRTWDGKSRLFSTWSAPTPTDSAPSVELLDLMFPNSYLDLWNSENDASVDVINCPPGKIVSLVAVKFRRLPGQPLTSPDPTFKQLASLSCKDGSAILLLHRLVNETPEYHAYIRTRFWCHQLASPTPTGRTYRGGNVDPASPSIRALLWDGRERKSWHEVSARKLFAAGPPPEPAPCET